jgi:tellurite resistance protein
MAKVQPARVSKRSPRVKLELDEALIALFVAAMNANLHVAPDEAARAHHLIWSTRHFRRKSGDTVGKLIQDMRALLQEGDTDAVMDGAARAIPARLRPATFAVLADLLLADGRMDAQERKFLRTIGAKLQIKPETVRRVVDVVLLKNAL